MGRAHALPDRGETSLTGWGRVVFLLELFLLEGE